MRLLHCITMMTFFLSGMEEDLTELILDNDEEIPIFITPQKVGSIQCRFPKLFEVNSLENLLQFKNLNTLILQGLSDISSLPKVITQLTSLKHLEFSENSISHIPEEICHLRQLESLNLSWNNLSDLPPEMLSMTNLKKLDISWNRLRSDDNTLEELKSNGVKVVLGKQIVVEDSCSVVGWFY